MRFKIPFTFSEINRLKKISKPFYSKIKHKKHSKFADILDSCDIDVTREEYLGIVIRNFLINFVYILIISNLFLFLLRIDMFYLYSFLVSFLFSVFILASQLYYPKMYANKKQREIEKNLLSALEDIMVQLNSGVPLFNIMVNISYGDYGVLSQEFKKAVKKINAGEPEADALSYLGKINSSNFFRRTLWQLSNGINSGSDMLVVIKDSIRSLNEEQQIQIQDYGSRLNPIIVVYMLIAVIIPALSVTFLTILSSMLNLEKTMAMLIFVMIFIFDILIQIMFLGLIKTRRPSLL